MILKEELEKDKDRGLSVGRDRLESAFQNRREFPSGTKLSTLVNSDFARQRGRMVLQRSGLRTRQAEPLSAQRTREKEEEHRCLCGAYRESLHVCHCDTHGLI